MATTKDYAYARVRVPLKIWREAKSQAALRGVTLEEWLRESIQQKLKQE